MPDKPVTISFLGNEYCFSFLKENFADNDSISLAKIQEKQVQDSVDILVIGHEIPFFDAGKIIKNHNLKAKTIIILSHGPYPHNQLPFAPAKGINIFNFRWKNSIHLIKWIYKLVQDYANAQTHYHKYKKRFLLLIEDEINFASYFVPVILRELERQTLLLTGSKHKNSHSDQKKVKKERPVLLLASNYEQAETFIDEYGDRMVGIISSLGFPRNGFNDLDAGLNLIDKIENLNFDLPLIIISSQKDRAKKISKKGTAFIPKDAINFLEVLRNYLLDYFGFGSFIFRNPDKNNQTITKAEDLKELIMHIEWIPVNSFVYHATKRHFSNWLGVHGHLELAEKIRPIPAHNPEKARKKLLTLLKTAL
ncbi:MAG: hypothetical protein ACQES9_13185 [Myxococcota bacterium]